MPPSSYFFCRMQEDLTCDYEYFEGRERLLDRLGRKRGTWNLKEIENTKEEIRRKHHVPLPSWYLMTRVSEDMTKDGVNFDHHRDSWNEQVIRYWRNNRGRYPTPAEEAAERRRLQEEEEARKREARGPTGNYYANIDPDKTYPPGSAEEYFAKIARNKRARKIEEENLRRTRRQLGAMRDLVAELPKGNQGGAEDDEVLVDVDSE